MKLLRRAESAIYRFFKRREEQRQLAWQTTTIIKSDEAGALAKAWADITIAAIKERRPICRHCMQPYEPTPRPWTDYVRLRAVLMIPDREPDPMLCDPCFESAVCAFNPEATNIGTRNDGAANLCLRQLNG